MQYVTPGSVDLDVTIRIIDSSDGTPETGVTSASGGLALWYRVGATGAMTAITEADHTNLTDAHSDGKLKHIADGLYRLSLPDAAVPASEGVVTWVGGTVTGMIVIPAAVIGRVVPLSPTVAGRTLDVSAGGEAGIDWANVGSPTTAVNLSATNIDVDQAVASVSGAVGSVTGAVGSVTGNVGGNVVGSVGSVSGAVGSVTGNVGGNVAGSVGSVTGSVGSVAAGGITAASIATGAVDADALAADAVAEIADTVLRRTMANIEASSYGDTLSVESLYGLLAASFESALASTTLTIRKSDGSTLGTKTLTTDAAAVPIVGIT